MPTIRGNGPQSVYVCFDGKIEPLDRLKAQNLPNSRWNKSRNGWLCRSSLRNLERIVHGWPNATWDDEAYETLHNARDNKDKRDKLVATKQVDESQLQGFPFKTEPWPHQKQAMLLGRDMPYFAYLMDQGTGKTKVALDDIAYNWIERRIEAALILCPNSIKTNWVAWPHMVEGNWLDAVDTHMSDVVPVEKAVWISNGKKADKKCWNDFEHYLNNRTNDNLIVMVVNYEALTVPRVFDFLDSFVQTFKTMIVCDESTYIKTPGASRTRAAQKLRDNCSIARIMTGTPIIKRPIDAFSQFRFLDEDVLGYGSFYAFRNRYCNMGGWENKQIVSYKNLDELSDKIASCSFRVMLKDCLDVPDKIYLPTRYVTMSKPQLKAYSTMLKDFYAEHDSGTVEARIVLTQQMRLQEITGGYLPIVDELGERIGTQELVDPKHNPKFKEVMELLDGQEGQYIIWSCFHSEIDGMKSLLDNVEVFDGRVSEDDRLRIRQEFKEGKISGIIANATAGGMGIDEFKVADLSIYLSNQNGNTEGRMQSEARTYRAGMTHACRFVDVLASNSVDIKIRRMIDSDVTLSQTIMRDGVRSVL